MKFTLLTGLLSLMILAGCNSHADDPPPVEKKVSRHDVQGEFRSKTYIISDHEHVVIFDIPDRFISTRCWTFVDDKTNTSHMHCDDEGAADLPLQGSELEK